MSSEIYTFILGVLLGTFLTLGVVSTQIRSNREQCEANLPRSEHCVQVWVKQPKEVK